MSDNLVKQLRDWRRAMYNTGWVHLADSMVAVADRIEELEAKLEKADAEYIRKDVLDALVATAREQALREAAEVAAEEANWVPHKSDDFRKAVLALIEKKNPGG